MRSRAGLLRHDERQDLLPGECRSPPGRAWGPNDSHPAWLGGKGMDMQRSTASRIYATAQPVPKAAAADKLTVAEACEVFIKRKTEIGAWSPLTIEWNRRELRRFAQLGPTMPISAVDADWLMRFLDALSGLALASQKTRYALAVEFCTWAWKRGWVSPHPAQAVDDDDLPWRGKRARRLMGAGKTLLRNSEEVQAYLAAANKLLTGEERVAATLPLLCGLRSGEVRHLRRADVDFGAGVLWIRPSDGDDDASTGWNPKSVTSCRTVALPDELATDLRGLCANRAPGDWLFPDPDRAVGLAVVEADGSTSARPAVRSYRWLIGLVDLVCEAARTADNQEIRRVTPHGLRGTYATLLTLAGTPAPDVARALGHADRGATAERHYVGAPKHVPHLRLAAGGGR